MNTASYISSVLGLLGVAVNFFIYHQNDRKRLLSVKLISDIVWLMHYSLISAKSGAVVCAISVIREIVFLNKEHRWAKSNAWLAVFFSLNFISLFFTWRGIVSILPAISAMISIVVFWIGNPRIARCFQFPISVAFLIYNSANRSYMGILNEIITLFSIITAMLRRKEKKQN